MITVSGGLARLRVNYSVNLNMTEEEWNALSERKQNEILDNRIDWLEVCRSAEIDEIDVDDIRLKKND